MKFIAIIFVTTFVCETWAQVNSQPLIILNSQDNRLSDEQTLDSGRYTVKPRPPKKEKKALTEDPAPSTEKVEIKKNEGELPQKAAQPIELEKPKEATTFNLVAPDPAVPNKKKDSGDEAGLFQQARDAVVGGSPEALEEYRSFLPPDDQRRNMIELKVAPMFLYNDSNSSYWYRSYQMFTPGYSLASDIWVTPLFGLNASYMKSVAGSLKDSNTTDTFVPASHEWLSIGLRFRRFYGLGRNVPMLTVGLDYREYNFRVPNDDAQRVRLKTTGPRLLFETNIPSSNRYSWIYDFEVTPFSRHQEISTGTSVQSGADNETFGFGLGVGGEYKLARTSRMFYKVSYFLERTMFSGAANRADPNSGQTPANVPVNNAFMFFQFGYIWGR